MISEQYRIDHIAVVVESLEEALSFWRDQLGLLLTHIDTVQSMQVKIAFLPLGDSKIELIQPLDGDSGVARFLQNRGPGLHHLCIEVEDLPKKLTQLRKNEVKLINEEPVVMEDGRQLAFVHPHAGSGVLIELYQSPKEDD